MQKLFRCLVLAAAAAGVASTAAAGELSVTIANGRATVVAKDVPLRDILAEWARVGSTRMVNSEKLLGGPISLELIDMPEKEALDILLRSAAGYMTGPRPEGATGASMYDRVMILATSRPPAASLNPTPQPFNRQAIQQIPQPPPDDDDEGEPGDQGPNAPPGMNQGPPGGPNGPPQTMPFPGQTPQNPNMMPPGAMPPGAMPPGAAPPTTSPRPGMLPPQPPPGPGNPYSPLGRPPGANGRGGGPVDPDDR